MLGPTLAIQQETIQEILEPLNSPACNAHLVMLIFDVILLTLFPEMGIELITQESRLERETGSEDLRENDERGSGDDASGVFDPDVISMAAL